MAKKSISRTPEAVESAADRAAHAAPSQPLFTSVNSIEYLIASPSDSDTLRDDADFFFGAALKLLKDFAHESNDDRADGIVTLFEMCHGARRAANEFDRTAKRAGGAL